MTLWGLRDSIGTYRGNARVRTASKVAAVQFCPGGSGRGSEGGASASPPKTFGMSFNGLGRGGRGPGLGSSNSTGVRSFGDRTICGPRRGGVGGSTFSPRAITVESAGLRTIVTFGPGTSGVRGRGCRSTCSSGFSGSGPGFGSLGVGVTRFLKRVSMPGLGTWGRGALIVSASPGSLAIAREPLAGDLICRAWRDGPVGSPRMFPGADEVEELEDPLGF